jgi:hypothetical protein
MFRFWIISAAALGLSLVHVAAAGAQVSAGDPFVLERVGAHAPSFGDQREGAVAKGPGEYFAVWLDRRFGGLLLTSYDLYAQRILPDGTVAAPGSIELLRDRDREITGPPAVAWNGSVYLVAWHEGLALFGMRVDALGNVLDPGGFLIDSRPSQGRPAVASDGEDFLVAHADGGTLFGVRVSGGGAVLDPSPLIIASGASAMGFPQVRFGAGVYMVVWAHEPPLAIRGARVTGAGAVLDPGGFNISGSGLDIDAHLAFDGENFFVTWQRANRLRWDQFGAVVTPEGLVATGPTLLIDSSVWNLRASGHVAWNGSHHVITVTTDEPVLSNADLYALMVDAAGAVASGPFPVSTLEGRSQVAKGIASMDGDWFVLWEGNRVSGSFFVYDTEGARIDGSGLVLDAPDPIDVSSAATWQINSATAFDGENFLSVFEDWRVGPPHYLSDLYAVRTSAAGEPVDATAIEIASAPLRSQEQPDIAFGAGQYAIVYETSTDVAEVRMVRLLPDGTRLDPPSGLLVGAAQPTGSASRPQIAFNGEHYCVVWYDGFPTTPEFLRFRLMGADGAPASDTLGVPDSIGAEFDGFGIAAGADGSFLLVWRDFFSDSIRATRIGPAGTVEQSHTVASTGSWIVENPRVGFNGEAYLVAWAQGGPGGEFSLHARALDAEGAPVGATLIVAGPAPEIHRPAVFADGDSVMVLSGRTAGGLSETLLARVASDGTLLEPAAAIASFDRNEANAHASFALGNGVIMATHSLWAGNPHNGVRAQGQMFDLNRCYADCDGSGGLDFFDFLCFQNLFATADLRADCDESGSLDFFDFLCFQSAFAAGCE